MGLERDEQTADVLRRWADVLTALEADPMLLADQLDWVAKKALLEGYRRRDNLDWDAPRLELVDLQYSDVDPHRGLAQRLQQRGRLQRITTDEEVDAAEAHPPEDTRAWFRGECIRRYGDDVAAASWDSVIFDLSDRAALQRVPTLDPFRGTRQHVGELLDRTETGADLVRALAAGA